jgi:hypothetical protein
MHACITRELSRRQGLTMVFGGFGGRSTLTTAEPAATATPPGGLRGSFTGLPLVPQGQRLPPPPLLPPPAAGQEPGRGVSQAGPSSSGGGVTKLSVASRDLLGFVSPDVTSLLQPQVAGLPPTVDSAGGCACCLVDDDDEDQGGRGCTLHSVELFDPALELWLPAQVRPRSTGTLCCVSRLHPLMRSLRWALAWLLGLAGLRRGWLAARWVQRQF